MFVKVCGVTTLDDALLAAGLGADAIGMIFAASPRRITNAQARDIVHRLPPEVLTVGVFRNDGGERVVRVVNEIGLKAVQLHGSETAEETRWIGERVPAVLKAFAIDDPELVRVLDDDEVAAAYGPHRLLIDSPMPGSGEIFDWARLDDLAGDRPYVLAGGLSPDNVTEAIEMLDPWGVDVATGVEAAPGRKDPVKVRRFLAAARAAVPLERGPTEAVGRRRPPPPTPIGPAPFDWGEDHTWQ